MVESPTATSKRFDCSAAVRIPLVIILIFGTFHSAGEDLWFLRPIVVIATAAAITSRAFEDNWLFSNRAVVWVGNISYAVYLVHWPVVVYYKYWSASGRLSYKGE